MTVAMVADVATITATPAAQCPRRKANSKITKKGFTKIKLCFFYVQVTNLYFLVCFVIAKVHIFKVLFPAKIKFTTCFTKIQITRYYTFCYFHFFHRCS